MSQPLLVPLDGSPRAELVLPWAALIARARNWSIHLVRAARPTTMTSSGMLGDDLGPELYEQAIRAESEEGTAYLHEVRQRALADLPDVETSVRIGGPDEVVLDVADEIGAAAIAMVSHGRSGLKRALLGSIAERIVHHATVPVLVVRAPTEDPLPPPSLDRILVPLDGSMLAERALDLANDLAPEHGTLLLVRAELPVQEVVPQSEGMVLFENLQDTAAATSAAETYLKEIGETRARPGTTVLASVVVDDAADTILKAAHDQQASLIVMSTHGLTGTSRFFIGSVADRIIRHAEVPVMLVSARALAANIVGHRTIRDLMTRDLTTVGADEPLIVAVRKLLRRRVSGAPVVDASGALVGVLSEADLVEWQGHLAETLVEEETLDPSEYVRRLATETVKSVMTAPATTVPETALLSEAIELFKDRGLRRLPVVNDGKLVGIVTRADVLRGMLAQWEGTSGPAE